METIIESLLQEMEERRQSGLPIGYRYRPNDVELLDHYLLPRLKGENLYPDPIMDLDVYQYDPHQLPLDEYEHAGQKEAYFFTREQRRNLLSDISIRPTPYGYWKVHEENVPIYRDNEIIGFKNKLFFYVGNNPVGHKTDWKMVEYKYDPDRIPPSRTIMMEMESYIICRVRFEDRIDEEEHLVEELPKEESDFDE